MELCREFPALSPWNVYDLEIRHYLAFTKYLDRMRTEASRGGRQ